MSEIVFKNVSKSFGETKVIENLNLTLKEGEFTVLVGASGCGKTTLLRMIAGIGPATSGEIFMDGVEISKVPPGKRDIAMVFQNYAIYPTMTVRGNIEFPPYVKGFPELTDYAIGIYETCIRFCDSLGIGRLVIHGVSRALDDPSQTRESVEAMNLRLYRSLIPALQECRVTVCLENLFTRYGRQIVEGACADPRQAAAFIDRLNEEAGGEYFGFCVDTGHLNILGKNQEEYILALGERIKAVHLHDNWGDDDRHLAPYAGNIRWREVIGALGKAGYRGNLNFETHQQVSLSRVDRELVPVLLRAIGETGRVFEGWLARE